MPDVVSNEELNALAAEYVLGTLDYEERKGATALLEVDPTFRGIVRIWERRFGDLHLMVEAVEPDPQLWLRIKPKMATVEQIALAIPSHVEERRTAAAAATPAAEPAPPTAPAVAAPPTAPAVDAPPAEPKADAAVAESTAPADASPLGEGAPAEAKLPETKPAETKPPETTPGETTPADAKPTEAPPAVVEAELKLAELAALLPVTGDQSRGAAEGDGGASRAGAGRRAAHPCSRSRPARLCAAGADEHARHAGGCGGAGRPKGRSRLDGGDLGDGLDRGRARRADQRLAVLPRAAAGATAGQHAAQPDHERCPAGPESGTTAEARAI